MVVSTIMFVLLMFTSIPVVYDLFNVAPATTEPLWTLGGREGVGHEKLVTHRSFEDRLDVV